MSSQTLQVGVIGAGIAGLSTAIALSRAGHEVQVFEKSHFRNEVGAAITITPNGTAVLDQWDFDFIQAGAVENCQIRMQMGDTLECLWRDSFEDDTDAYGHKTWLLHRVDLHEGLRKIVMTSGRSGVTAPTIRLGAEVVSLDCDQGLLTMTDGSVHQKDLIVVADGTHCRFVSSVTGQDLATRKTGRSAYRCLVPMEKVMANADTAALFLNERPGFLVPIIPGSTPINGVVCVTYPCRNSSILNVAVAHTTKDGESGSEDWNSPTSTASILETMHAFHPTLKLLISMAEPSSVKVYILTDHAPVSSMHRGRVVLIGDAAHPLLPTHGQGAGISLEDAGALEILLAGATTEAVEERLALFSRLRVPRCATTHLLSNGLLEKREAVEEQIRMFYTGTLPPREAMPYSKPMRSFFFDYDVFREARKMLRGEDPVFFAEPKT